MRQENRERCISTASGYRETSLTRRGQEMYESFKNVEGKQRVKVERQHLECWGAFGSREEKEDGEVDLQVKLQLGLWAGEAFLVWQGRVRKASRSKAATFQPHPSEMHAKRRGGGGAGERGQQLPYLG